MAKKMHRSDMTHIRKIKPEFFSNRKIYEVSQELPNDGGFALRVIFQGLWVCSDAAGRFKWALHELKTRICPYDGVDFEHAMRILEKHDYIRRYTVDGRDYGFIPGWKEHQAVAPAEPVVFPDPPSPLNNPQKEKGNKELGKSEIEKERNREGRKKGGSEVESIENVTLTLTSPSSHLNPTLTPPTSTTSTSTTPTCHKSLLTGTLTSLDLTGKEDQENPPASPNLESPSNKFYALCRMLFCVLFPSENFDNHSMENWVLGFQPLFQTEPIANIRDVFRFVITDRFWMKAMRQKEDPASFLIRKFDVILGQARNWDDAKSTRRKKKVEPAESGMEDAVDLDEIEGFKEEHFGTRSHGQ